MLKINKLSSPSLSFQVVYFGDSMRSDMFPASSFGKWETVMIVEEMEGEGVPKSDAAKSNEAQVEPQEKRGKFEVSSLKQLFPLSSHSPPPSIPQLPQSLSPLACCHHIYNLRVWVHTGL